MEYFFSISFKNLQTSFIFNYLNAKAKSLELWMCVCKTFVSKKREGILVIYQ